MRLTLSIFRKSVILPFLTAHLRFLDDNVTIPVTRDVEFQTLLFRQCGELECVAVSVDVGDDPPLLCLRTHLYYKEGIWFFPAFSQVPQVVGVEAYLFRIGKVIP